MHLHLAPPLWVIPSNISEICGFINLESLVWYCFYDPIRLAILVQYRLVMDIGQTDGQTKDVKNVQTRMWADAQRGSCPAEYMAPSGKVP